MKSFRKVLGVFVLAAAVAVTGAVAPKATSALVPVEHDRSGLIMEHDRNTALFVEHDRSTALFVEHERGTALFVEHDRSNA